MVSAYILAVVATGWREKAIEGISHIPNVISFSYVTGNYDIIARVEANTLEDIMSVTDSMHATGAITSTLTHVIASEHRMKP